MWVIGCIDAHGAIFATPTKEGRAHTAEESKGKRWRWCVWSQEFINIPCGAFHELTEEELFAVWNWLRSRDLTDDRTMPEPAANPKCEIHNPKS